ncbi:MAG TPA: hypothetical protein VGQ64_12865 [Candidatus Limnocylindrales bacterium]|jgi:hypothetical protein|nr:hypothetical protein [Candidatus Limnocylindrales bacterium]
MTPRSTIRLILFGGLIAAAGLLSACGASGGSGGSSADGSAAPADTTDVTADTDTAEPDADETDPSEPGTTLNACEILTAADLASATKTKDVREGEFKATPSILSPGKSECRYEGDFGGIIVDLTPEDGANLYDAAVGAYKDAALIDAVGDGAFYSADNHRAFIWKGKVTLMLTIFLKDGLDATALSTALGQLAVAKV